MFEVFDRLALGTSEAALPPCCPEWGFARDPLILGLDKSVKTGLAPGRSWPGRRLLRVSAMGLAWTSPSGADAAHAGSARRRFR
jgi:hypothetical protein